MTTLAHGTDSLTRDALTVLQPGFVGTSAPNWLLRGLGEGLAAVGLFGRNIDSPGQLAELTAQLRSEHPQVLVALDEEGGDVTRLEARTGSSFPGNLALGHIDDTELTRQVAWELGNRLADCGVRLNWAPCADVNSNPDNPGIGVRSFGSEPELVARHTAAYVTGMQAAGVAACAKHFPGHGDTSLDSHQVLPRVDADLDTLRERELAPFRAAVAAGSACVMSAHLLLPALDANRPATLSPAALTGLLRAPVERGGLGFDGLIVTDALEMQAISGTYGLQHGAVLALAAGADALCVGGGLAGAETVAELRHTLVQAVRAGQLPEQRLAEAASRVRALATAVHTGAVRAGVPDAEGPTDPASHAGRSGSAEPGLSAARRALTVTGAESHRPLDAPPFVARFTPVANPAVGEETPWGLGAALARFLPATVTRSYSAGEAAQDGTGELVSRVLRAAGERRIVAVVRDVHRHYWMADALDALLAARPDSLVVEMGVPQAQPAGALHIATHGAAGVCGQAAAEVILGRHTGS